MFPRIIDLNASIRLPKGNKAAGPFRRGTTIYAMFLDFTEQTAGTDPHIAIEVWKSSDWGLTWAEQDAGNHPWIVVPAGGSDSAVIYPQATQKEDNLWIAWGDLEELKVIGFDMSSDTFGTQIAGPGYSWSAAQAHDAVAVWELESGDLALLVSDPSGGTVEFIYDTGTPAWSSDTQRSAMMTVSWIMGSNERIHCLLNEGDIENNNLWHVSFVPGGAADSEQQIIDDRHFYNSWHYQPATFTKLDGTVMVAFPYLKEVSYGEGEDNYQVYRAAVGVAIAESEADPEFDIEEVSWKNTPEYLSQQALAEVTAAAGEDGRLYVLWETTPGRPFGIVENHKDEGQNWRDYNRWVVRLPQLAFDGRWSTLEGVHARQLGSGVGIGMLGEIHDGAATWYCWYMPMEHH